MCDGCPALLDESSGYLQVLQHLGRFLGRMLRCVAGEAAGEAVVCSWTDASGSGLQSEGWFLSRVCPC